MVSLSVDFNPGRFNPDQVTRNQVTRNVASEPALDLADLVIPSVAGFTAQRGAGIVAERIFAEIGAGTATTPLRAIANEFMMQTAGAEASVNRITAGQGMIAEMMASNTARIWENLLGTEISDSPAVTLAKQPQYEYVSQLEASLAV